MSVLRFRLGSHDAVAYLVLQVACSFAERSRFIKAVGKTDLDFQLFKIRHF